MHLLAPVAGPSCHRLEVVSLAHVAAEGDDLAPRSAP